MINLKMFNDKFSGGLNLDDISQEIHNIEKDQKSSI